MKYVTLWTSIHGFENMSKGSKAFAYNKESKMNNVAITVPVDSISLVNLSSKLSNEIEFIIDGEG